MSENTVLTQISDRAFEALVSKGIYAMLFPIVRDGNSYTVDTTTNILAGYPVGNITGSGDTADSTEYQDQLSGGMYKTFVGGAVDPGDVVLSTYFAPAKGKPKIEGIVNSMVFTPQFALILARKKDSATLQGFFVAGVNYQGGNDIQGNIGTIIGSSLRFKVSGEPKSGYANAGEFPMSLYEGTGNGNGTQTASATLPQELNLNLDEPAEITA